MIRIWPERPLEPLAWGEIQTRRTWLWGFGIDTNKLPRSLWEVWNQKVMNVEELDDIEHCGIELGFNKIKATIGCVSMGWRIWKPNQLEIADMIMNFRIWILCKFTIKIIISNGLSVFYKVLIRGYVLVVCAILITRAEERWVQKTKQVWSENSGFI